MLRLEDRIQVALGAGMGIQLSSSEVHNLATILVRVQQLRENDKQSVAGREGVVLAACAMFPEK